jgi:glycosyltransferase involved in cell wall biosynthesis
MPSENVYFPRTRPLSEKWTLSLVVPVLDEENNISPFLKEVFLHLAPHIPELEIIFIDDGSTDGSLDRIRAEASRDSRIFYLSFSRNFGKEAAMSAGLDFARGDAVVLIDVDLQHPLATILEFVRLWREQNYDMIYGIREKHTSESLAKKTSSRMFYRLFNKLVHTPIPANASDFRLLDRRVVDALCQLPERSRFMKGIYSWVGFRSTGVVYTQAERSIGSSRFNYWKLWNFALDGLVSFSTWPLRVWSYVGGIIGVLAFLYMTIIVTKTIIYGIDTPGYASMMTAVLFFGGIQLLSIGILGEYIGRLFLESKRRPLYLVAETNLHLEKETTNATYPE